MIITGIIMLFADKKSEMYEDCKFIHSLMAYGFAIAALIGIAISVIISAISH